MLRTDYRFWIEREDAAAPTQMYPQNFGACSFVYEKQETWNFSRRKLRGQLIFMNSDYDYFKTEYDETDSCYRYDLTIERKCEGVWVVDYLGYFALNKGKFNFERCNDSVEPVLNDKYDCIIKNLDTQVNIVNWSARHSIRYVYHELLGDTTVDYENFYLLTDVITKILVNICVIEGVSSDFFENAVNPVTGDTNQLNHLMISQKSDIIYPDAYYAATKGEISIGEMFEALYNMFQVKWDFVDDYITFTHVKNITASAGLNLTVDPYLKTTAYKKEFEWDVANLYKYEKWNFCESANEDFRGVPIKYDDNCSKDTEDNTKEYNIPKITTDIKYIHDIPERISGEGFVIAVTDGTHIVDEEGILTGDDYPNGHLSTANLHSHYWRYDRIYREGEMNNVATIFLSWKKLKKIIPLTIILCCDEEFDMMDYVTTEFGRGEVYEAEFFPLSSKLELKIKV